MKKELCDKLVIYKDCNQFVTAFFSGHNYWPCVDELWMFCLVVNDPVAHCRFATGGFRFLV